MMLCVGIGGIVLQREMVKWMPSGVARKVLAERLRSWR